MDENINGQVKCPKCGATDISQNPNTGKLRCNFCRHEFEQKKSEKMNVEANKLEGVNISERAGDINKDKNFVTIKCKSCGAEVVINTNDSTHARCHWCRNILSINNKISNGAVPDVVLPFKVKREEAKESIESYVGNRKFFARKEFLNQFTTDNIMGTYFPYMIIDANEHVKLSGVGEIQTKKYSYKKGDREEYRYDADVYSVSREYDLAVNGLTIESSIDKINTEAADKTNNIINAIMPFDTENAVAFDSNYLRNYSSEKRNLNVNKIKPVVDEQLKDIARFKARSSISEYDRGVRWDDEDYDIKGQNWNSAYFPVWLYSYKDVNKLHYIAVNGRTKETEGSVPLDKTKLAVTSLIIGVILYIIMSLYGKGQGIGLIAGVAFFIFNYFRYTKKTARHTYEKETKAVVSNMQKYDRKIDSKKKLSNSRIEGRNDDTVKGTRINIK